MRLGRTRNCAGLSAIELLLASVVGLAVIGSGTYLYSRFARMSAVAGASAETELAVAQLAKEILRVSRVADSCSAAATTFSCSYRPNSLSAVRSVRFRYDVALSSIFYEENKAGVWEPITQFGELRLPGFKGERVPSLFITDFTVCPTAAIASGTCAIDNARMNGQIATLVAALPTNANRIFRFRIGYRKTNESPRNTVQLSSYVRNPTGVGAVVYTAEEEP